MKLHINSALIISLATLQITANAATFDCSDLNFDATYKTEAMQVSVDPQNKLSISLRTIWLNSAASKPGKRYYNLQFSFGMNDYFPDQSPKALLLSKTKANTFSTGDLFSNPTNYLQNPDYHYFQDEATVQSAALEVINGSVNNDDFTAKIILNQNFSYEWLPMPGDLHYAVHCVKRKKLSLMLSTTNFTNDDTSLCATAGDSLLNAKVGYKCKTEKNYIFEKVRLQNSKVAWQSKGLDGQQSGLIWSDHFGLAENDRDHSDAAKLCAKNRGVLPSIQQFKQGEKEGFREVLQNMHNRWFWSSTVSASRVNEGQTYGFYVDNSSFSGATVATGFELVKGSVRCIY